MTQDNREGREVRSNIQALLQRAQHDAPTLASDAGAITSLLDAANAEFAHVTRAREQAADSELFRAVAGAGADLARALERRAGAAGAASPAELVRRLAARYARAGGDAGAPAARDPWAFDWAALGRAAAPLFAAAPARGHMLGPMGAPPPARRAGAARGSQRRREPPPEAARPDELAAAGAGGDGGEHQQETDRCLEEMWRALRAAGGAAPLLDVVLNHASFSQTVENLFALSFLVRDARVELARSPGGGVTVRQRARGGGGAAGAAGARAGADAGGAAAGERVQFVVALDFEEWRRWKAGRDPAAALMPHRPERAGAGLEGEQQQQQQDAAEGGGGGGGSDASDEEEAEPEPQPQARGRKRARK